MQIAALLVSALFAAQAAPTASTGAAESVTTGSAALTGVVNPNGAATTYRFEYGTSTSYGLTTPDVDAGSGSADVPARAQLSGLSANTTYHYRIVANQAGGTPVTGGDRTFRTASAPSLPSMSSRAATAVTGTTATLNAGVNPRGLATNVYFEYGTSTSYGTRTPPQAIGAGTSTVSVSAAIGGLRPNTRYNFRAVATSAAGVARTSNRTFTTPRVPTGVAITPSTVRPTWGSGLTITGTVSGSGTTPVAVEKLDFPFQGAWIPVATANSSSSGAFTLTVPPLFATTRLRVATRTPNVVTSGVSTINVAVKVGLKTSRVSTRRTRVTGTIWPSVPSGRASLQRQSRSGRWIPVTRTNVSALSGDRSRYTFTFTRSRSRTMNYRVVVNPRDNGLHVSGTSRVVSVKRARP
ncbi:hypothetical protein DVA67_016490 [Solirubrobacter sp. CPCC 204708]|uniref:Fibronectin type-III domain-containing protein n=1 Tax=Solirubrobacter deserti TaxID=2282478 RepID=A0ABT4RRT5_9ACTN|nr:hypothetical protein [Solirubrobacter deserti]MBE2317583.1 hypothetical protein [Solirubrobacter deserti]MDA0141277.1 hypothetical protein [Solirubrobacter deserti]